MHKLLSVCWRRWVTAKGLSCSSIWMLNYDPPNCLNFFVSIFSLFSLPIILSIFKRRKTSTSYPSLYKPTNKETHIYRSLSFSLSPALSVWKWNTIKPCFSFSPKCFPKVPLYISLPGSQWSLIFNTTPFKTKKKKLVWIGVIQYDRLL